MSELRAVLLDAGGIFTAPDHDIMSEAFARAGFEVDREVLDHAHYRAALVVGTDFAGDLPWAEFWPEYVERYVRSAGTPDDLYDDAFDHIATTFQTLAPWNRILPGSRKGLRQLEELGLILGVVSNSDGTAAQRLAEADVLQVGPGLGVNVATVIDSGVVGVSKPDPRIFHLALDALSLEPEETIYVGDTPAIDVVGARRAGIRPVVMDPFELQLDDDYDRVGSLSELATLIRTGHFSDV